MPTDANQKSSAAGPSCGASNGLKKFDAVRKTRPYSGNHIKENKQLSDASSILQKRPGSAKQLKMTWISQNDCIKGSAAVDKRHWQYDQLQQQSTWLDQHSNTINGNMESDLRLRKRLKMKIRHSDAVRSQGKNFYTLCRRYKILTLRFCMIFRRVASADEHK